MQAKKKKEKQLFFRYYKIMCLKYNGFDTFLTLLKQNVIKVSLILRFSKAYGTIGKNKNKNMVFQINDSEIEKLYKKNYFYEN